MNRVRQRPLGVGPLRAFEAVARRLSFSGAADELHLTQSAISRQIRALEEELGAVLFLRGTRHVELTGTGATLLRTVAPLLDRLDATVRQIRVTTGRRHVSVTTFASFASLWLIPRLHSFQRLHPDIDIRISASDVVMEMDDPELDIALRYCHPKDAPPGATKLFGEVLTPVVGHSLAEQAQRGLAPPLREPADLARHTLLEEDDPRPSAEFLTWRYWLARRGLPNQEPLRWLYLNYTHQQIQAALAGQGVALARLALVQESLQRGELVEPFGEAGRERSPFTYWLAHSQAAKQRPELRPFIDWVIEQARETRRAVGEPD
ncbi:LysR substrate-binding domain-containing protein [Aquincola sp. J276]|uniref:LysR substrate-binding domain-containing protein n=1 Tax=Aquincola sp. J276 TaxID=2898432 RepID=UPI0021512743|nr:LysR substrate-binding domain-containing protein [Aquincola sp. J276]MCR5866487.1 LysR substrate-binding domain-containing protein [Aquincola sp. J276]